MKNPKMELITDIQKLLEKQVGKITTDEIIEVLETTLKLVRFVKK